MLHRAMAVIPVTAIILLAGIAGPRLLGPRPAEASSSTAGHTIQVTGQSRLKVAPNQATIALGVTAHASTATAAEREDGSRAQNVISALEKNNVPAGDISTQWFNLSSNSGQLGSNNQPQPISFTAQTNLNIKTTDLGQVGSIIDEALKSGADQVNNVEFSVAHVAHYTLEGYKQAMIDARTQAAALAKDAGVTLGPVVNIDATTGGNCCIIGAPLENMTSAAPAHIPFMPAPQEIDTSLNVTFSILP